MRIRLSTARDEMIVIEYNINRTCAASYAFLRGSADGAIMQCISGCCIIRDVVYRRPKIMVSIAPSRVIDVAGNMENGDLFFSSTEGGYSYVVVHPRFGYGKALQFSPEC